MLTIGICGASGSGKSTLADELARRLEGPCVLLKEYADSSINFTLRMWCLNADYWTLTFDMNEKVKKAFDENGISIPFPQMDVHMHTQAE